MHIISNEVDCMQDCRSREGLGGQCSPLQIFADNLTLTHSGGEIIPTTLLLPYPLNIQTFLRSRYVVAYINTMKLQGRRNRWGRFWKTRQPYLNKGKLIMPTILTLAPFPHLPTALSWSEPALLQSYAGSSMSHVTNVSQYTIVLCPQILGGVLTYKIHFWEDLPRLPPKILQLTQNPWTTSFEGRFVKL